MDAKIVQFADEMSQSYMGGITLLLNRMSGAMEFSLNQHLSERNSSERMMFQLLKEMRAGEGKEEANAPFLSLFLAKILYNHSLSLLSSGFHPHALEQEMQFCMERIVQILSSRVDTPLLEEIQWIATYAGGGDERIGIIMREMVEELGVNVPITFREGTRKDLRWESFTALSWNKGFLSPYFINDSQSGSIRAESAYLLLLKGNSLSSPYLSSLLNQCRNEKRYPLCLIAEEVPSDMLSIMIRRALSEDTPRLSVLSVPKWRDTEREELLQDLALFSGATPLVLNDHFSAEGKEITSLLGRTKQLSVNNREALFIEGAGDEESKSSHIDSLKREREKSSGKRKKSLEERITQLEGKTAFIHMGEGFEREQEEPVGTFGRAYTFAQRSLSEGVIDRKADVVKQVVQECQRNSLMTRQCPLGKKLICQALSALSSKRSLLSRAVSHRFLSSTQRREVREWRRDPLFLLTDALSEAVLLSSVLLNASVFIAKST